MSDWHNIIAISAGTFHTVGLKEDGTVVAVGASMLCNLSDWNNIFAVDADQNYTVALGFDKDGSIVAHTTNDEGALLISDWENIRLP